jgi:hypothetical protein
MLLNAHIIFRLIHWIPYESDRWSLQHCYDVTQSIKIQVSAIKQHYADAGLATKILRSKDWNFWIGVIHLNYAPLVLRHSLTNNPELAAHQNGRQCVYY